MFLGLASRHSNLPGSLVYNSSFYPPNTALLTHSSNDGDCELTRTPPPRGAKPALSCSQSQAKSWHLALSQEIPFTSQGLLGFCVYPSRTQASLSLSPLGVTAIFPLLQSESCDCPSLSHWRHRGSGYTGWQHGPLPHAASFLRAHRVRESVNPRATATQSLSLHLRTQVTSRGGHPFRAIREVKAELVL